MSGSLKMVNAQVILFKSGQINLSEMWDAIEKRLTDDHLDDCGDPFADDKAERQRPKTKRKTVTAK